MTKGGTTIVSAFMANITKPKYLETNDNNRKYTEHFIPLFRADVNKIIFIDSTVIDKYTSYENHNTKLVPYVKETSYLYEYMPNLADFNPTTNNPEKDTIEFMFTMCNKTEWIKEAIRLNYFETNNFTWVDFGIRHIFGCTDEEFIKKIETIDEKTDEKTDEKCVRIGTIWNLDNKYNIDIYKTIAWYFAGGVFGGNTTALLKFSDLMKEKCISIMTNRNTIMWEVNIWYLIWCENKELFDVYKCDHNATLVDNY